MIRDMPLLDAEMAGRPHDDAAAQRATMAIAAISGCTSSPCPPDDKSCTCRAYARAALIAAVNAETIH